VSVQALTVPEPAEPGAEVPGMTGSAVVTTRLSSVTMNPAAEVSANAQKTLLLRRTL
jgi:hypothetical protein